MLQQQGELEPASEALESALHAARELGHRRLECIALANLGQVAEAMHDDDTARVRFEQAVALARELGDRLSAGQVGGYLAALHGRHDRFDAARALFEASADALTEVGDPASLGLLLCDRAWLEHRAGDAAAAQRARDAAQRIAEEIVAAPGSDLGERLARLDAQLRGATNQAADRRDPHNAPPSVRV
jgi:tetratricopeptide (TPR) repeat protein